MTLSGKSSDNVLKSLKTSLLRKLQAHTLPDAIPPIGKIHPFRKITFKPMLHSDILFNLKSPKPVQDSLFYDWKHHVKTGWVWRRREARGQRGAESYLINR